MNNNIVYSSGDVIEYNDGCFYEIIGLIGADRSVAKLLKIPEGNISYARVAFHNSLDAITEHGERVKTSQHIIMIENIVKTLTKEEIFMALIK